jgi:hypothetical protein
LLKEVQNERKQLLTYSASFSLYNVDIFVQSNGGRPPREIEKEKVSKHEAHASWMVALALRAIYVISKKDIGRLLYSTLVTVCSIGEDVIGRID